MQTPRPSTWLLACVLATCCGRQGTQCLPAGRPDVLRVVYAPDGTPGVMFPPVDPKKMPPNPLLEDEDLWQSKRLQVVKDNENTGYGHQLTPEAVVRLEQLLFGLANDIPSSATPRPVKAGRRNRDRSRSRGGGLAGPAREDRQAPIYRAGRTDGRSPAPEVWPLQAGVRRRENYAPAELRPVVAEGNGGGTIWSPTSAKADAGVRPRARRPTEQQIEPGRVYQPDSEIQILANFQTAEQLARIVDQRRQKSHKAGSEEFAIQTPSHSRKADYGETKRVENARGWNTLRGMWGKRSSPPVEGPPAGAPTRWARSDDASESAAATDAPEAAADAADVVTDQEEETDESERPQPLRSM